MARKQLASFSLVFLASAVLAGQAHGLDLCGKSDYVPLCQSVVKDASDPQVALKVAMEHLILETERAREASARLGQIESLDVCKTNFNDAISSLQDGLENLKSEDKPSLNAKLSAALSFYVQCNDAVAKGGLVQLASGVMTTDAMLRELAAICLYLATL